MEWNGIPLLIVGRSGYARECYELIKYINQNSNNAFYDVLGFVSDKADLIGKDVIDGKKVVACDDNVEELISKHKVVAIVFGIGQPKIRMFAVKKYLNFENVIFPNVIHPSVQFYPEFVTLSRGNVINRGVTFTCNINVGDFNLFNYNCTIGHDTAIGSYNSFNPQCSVSGNMKIGDNNLFGVNCSALENLNIGDNNIIGAGAVLITNVENSKTLVGIPAKAV